MTISFQNILNALLSLLLGTGILCLFSMRDKIGEFGIRIDTHKEQISDHETRLNRHEDKIQAGAELLTRIDEGVKYLREILDKTIGK